MCVVCAVGAMSGLDAMRSKYRQQLNRQREGAFAALAERRRVLEEEVRGCVCACCVCACVRR